MNLLVYYTQLQIFLKRHEILMFSLHLILLCELVLLMNNNSHKFWRLIDGSCATNDWGERERRAQQRRAEWLAPTAPVAAAAVRFSRYHSTRHRNRRTDALRWAIEH